MNQRIKTRAPLLAIAVVLFAPPAQAQDEKVLLQAKAQFAREPPVADVVEKALWYFRVHPNVLDSLRTKSHTRAWLPLLASGYRYDDTKLAAAGNRDGVLPDNQYQNADDASTRGNSVSIGAVWDFRELVFNPAEVQVFGLIGVQRDIMLEATRTYYLRKQLVLRRVYQPPEDPMALAALDMRIDEFTAILDVLTGGWFSKTTKADDKDG